MTIRFEHFIIALLMFLLIMESGTSECPVESTVTNLEERIVTSVDSAEIRHQVPREVSVIETSDQVVIVDDPKQVPELEKHLLKKANRYQDTTFLNGAVIYSDILTDGRILMQDIKAEIDHLERTTTTTKTVVKRPGGLFFSPGMEYSPIGGMKGIESSLTYIRGAFGISAGGYYNFNNIPGEFPFGFTFKIHIKL